MIQIAQHLREEALVPHGPTYDVFDHDDGFDAEKGLLTTFEAAD